jgi:hypothetical protein
LHHHQFVGAIKAQPEVEHDHLFAGVLLDDLKAIGGGRSECRDRGFMHGVSELLNLLGTAALVDFNTN